MARPSIRIFDSHDAADSDDAAYYSSLKPQQRLDLVLELSAGPEEDEGKDASRERHSRVCRVVELETPLSTWSSVATRSVFMAFRG